ATPEVRAVRVFEQLAVTVAHREAARTREMRLDRREIPLEQCGIGLLGDERIEELPDGGRRIEARRTRTREQLRQELRAIGGRLEQRFVHQVRDHVAAPNVEDDRELRLQRHDVREVLLRTDAEVHVARPDGSYEVGNDELKSRFVRQKVVG